ncbi:MAG TPA: xanthine dehydrogenase family protein subunit M [Bryobacteraceae bacterium]|nr:xanthine dehydrogenase family protein subunit M [Bryobacteraceae bacterium]
MQSFEYANPATLKEAFAALGASWEDAAVLAGGTDLLSIMKDYVQSPKRVVNIKGIKELGGIARKGGHFRIGATVTLDELTSNAAVRSSYPALVQAALGVTSPQLRNMGTVGGDLCQRPRCWYFRRGFGLLAKGPNGEALVPTGENKFHAIFSNGPAYFVSASTLGPALVALGATVTIAGPSGNRSVPVEKFFVAPSADGQRETDLKPNEIVSDVLIPVPSTKNATYEVRQRELVDWPLAAASVALRMNGSTITSASIALGHVAPVIWRASQAEKMLVGKSISVATAEAAGEAAVANATPLSGNRYKVQLTKVAVKRALLAAAGIKA